ncbi:MAG: recombinase [Bacteroidetes bacterium]|nr:recombinase [Bacteroidota bacterium]
MKVCLLGDTHIGARNDSLNFHEFFKKFYDEVFFPYLREHNITNVIQLGDMFDRRKYINFQSLKHGREYLLDPLNELTTYALVGNHDTYYKNTNAVNSLDLLLRGYDNIQVINSPTEISFEDKKFLLVPWISPENEQECIDAIMNTNADAVVGHFEITGFEMYRGTLCDEGLDVSIFRRPPMVLSGHFHHRSQNGNVHYLGTPYEMTWSDHGDIKGFHIYDTDTGELEFIPNPFTMFHKILYDDTDKTMEEVVNIDYDSFKGTVIKLIVRNKNNTAWFDLMIDKLEKAGVSDIQVVEDHFHMDLEADDDIINEAEDTLTILTKYIDGLQLQSDRQRLDTLMQNLYHEALSTE